MMRSPELMAAWLCLVTACSGLGNTGKENGAPPPELVAAVPWANGAVPLHDAEGVLIPDEPGYPPIGANTPDPGSRPFDCSGLSQIEMPPFPELVQTFEPDGGDTAGIAEWWSSNDDETKGAFRTPGDAKWYGLPPSFDERFGLPAERVAGAPSCDGQPNDWVLHFRGGRFNYYGAAAERPLQAIEIKKYPDNQGPERCPGGTDVCPALPEPGATIDGAGLPIVNADGTEFEPHRHLYWDVSLYDGVSFWARRGPDGQPGMLFALQDKHTSDALNRVHQKFCRRIKACRPVCQNGMPCTLNPESDIPNVQDGPRVHRCFDPAVGVPMVIGDERCNVDGAKRCIEPALREELYPRCGPSACAALSYYPDPDFDGLECKPYEFTGSQAGHYCYGDVRPPPDEERCGDAWVAPVRLSTDWKLYVIPFTEFRQVGFAKRAPFLDLHSIYSIALQFPVGFADVYVDNVSFYRRRR